MINRNTEQTTKILKDIDKLNGIEFLDIATAVLVRLRAGYSGDNKTQEHINRVLDKVYFLKY